MKPSELLANVVGAAIMAGGMIMLTIYGFGGKSGGSWFVPLAHVLGALGAIMAIFVAILYLQESLDARRFNKLTEIVSSGIQQPLSELTDATQSQAAIAFLHKRYDYDLFRNRASNLIGGLLVWIEIGFGLIGIFMFFYPIYEWWSIGHDERGNVAHIWISPAILILMSILRALVNSLSWFIFGRWPNEAKWFHKQLLPIIGKQKDAAS